MLTAQVIGYLGSDAKVTEKGFSFSVSSKHRTAAGEEKTTWISCFANYNSKVMEYLKTGTMVYVSGELAVGIFTKDDNTSVPSVTMSVQRIELLPSKKQE